MRCEQIRFDRSFSSQKQLDKTRPNGCSPLPGRVGHWLNRHHFHPEHFARSRWDKLKGSVTALFAPRNNPQVEKRLPKLFIEEKGLLPHKAFDRQGCPLIHGINLFVKLAACLLYTSPSPRDLSTSRMPSSA